MRQFFMGLRNVVCVTMNDGYVFYKWVLKCDLHSNVSMFIFEDGYFYVLHCFVGFFHIFSFVIFVCCFYYSMNCLIFADLIVCSDIT